MKAQRYNLCTPVRQALINGGFSTVNVVNAINAALGNLRCTSDDAKLSGGTAKQPKKGEATYSVTETEQRKYKGVLTAPLLFDAWNTAVDKAHKVAAFETIALPTHLSHWLAKFKATDTEAKNETDTAPAPENAPVESAPVE
jgi:hypothetical protein